MNTKTKKPRTTSVLGTQSPVQVEDVRDDTELFGIYEIICNQHCHQRMRNVSWNQWHQNQHFLVRHLT